MTASKGAPKTPASAVTLLRFLTKWLSSIDHQDLDDLVAGKARLAIVRPDPPALESSLAGSRVAVVDYDRLQNDLKAAPSTDVGFEILHDARLTRAQLERVARSLDLAVMKQDTVSRLEEKIVEALIGSRLNSRAVRGR